MENVINAKDFGFLPENSGVENSRALNEAVKNGGEIHIDLKGTYEISDVIFLKGDTTLIFGEDVALKRVKSENETAYAFINVGAFTKNYDKNIKIYGLKLVCNGVYDNLSEDSKLYIAGLKGHLAFFYVRNLEINGFEVYDLPAPSFAVQVCNFENIKIENCRIEGKKDGIHLGKGKNFVIKDCNFKTFDDPIALNAHDYAVSNPELGWIENGTIENCVDLDDTSTTGFFCRILSGAWVDWFPNMKIRNSDTVVSNGRIYRALLKTDGSEYISKTAPTHEKGIEILDGIKWVMVQEDVLYNCGCRNITFKNIRLEKKRPIAFSMHFDDDEWSHSYYPGAKAPVQSDIRFENIKIKNKIPVLISAVTPIDKIKLKASDFKNSIIVLDTIRSATLDYPVANFEFENVLFDSYIVDLIKCKNLRKTNFMIK